MIVEYVAAVKCFFFNQCYSDLYHNSVNFNSIKGLKIVFLNINRLINKLSEVKYFIDLYNIDILCLSETWLKADLNEFEVRIADYQLFRCDRIGKIGGGVAIYVRNSDRIHCNHLETENVVDFQSVLLEVRKVNTKPFKLFCVYRRTNSKCESDQKLLDIIESISSEDIIIGGDINYDYFKNINNEWFQRTTDLSLKQLIRSPTRITDRSSSSCIDHIYTNDMRYVFNYGTIDYELSDHKPVFICRKINKLSNINVESHKTIQYRDYENFNELNLKKAIEELKQEILLIKNLNKKVENFENKIKQLFNQFIPLKTKRVKIHRSIPYMKKTIKQLITKRNKIKISFNRKKRNNNLDYDLFNKYKELRNKITSEIRKSKKSFYNKKINDCKNDSRKLWKIISEVIQTKKSFNIEKSAYDLNQMNDSFIDSALKLSRSFSENIIFDDLTPKTDKCFSIEETNETVVEKVIEKLDKNKSTGFDGISAKLLKTTKSIVPVITHLINTSFSQSIVPKQWKIATVKPIFKGGKRSDLSHYRPVSVLPVISKVMERIVFENFYNFIESNNLLTESRFGFRSRHCCSDALASLLYSIYSGINKNKKVCVISLDIKKAFDCVSHPILLYKLFRFGLDFKTLKWFESFLEDRKQCVKEYNKFSELRDVIVGQPQGALLSPLLFSIYINDLSDIEIDGQILFYADDTNIVFFADSNESL